MSNQARVWYQTKPSADRLGSAYYRHGPLVPLEQRKPGLIGRLRAALTQGDKP